MDTTPAEQRLLDHIDAIDYTTPGLLTDPDDPRVFALPPLPDADPYTGPGPDVWASRLGWWEVAAKPNPETVIVRFDHIDGFMWGEGAYVAGEVTYAVYADKASRDAALKDRIGFCAE